MTYILFVYIRTYSLVLILDRVERIVYFCSFILVLNLFFYHKIVIQGFWKTDFTSFSTWTIEICVTSYEYLVGLSFPWLSTLLLQVLHLFERSIQALEETKRFIRDDAVHSRWHWWGCGRPMHRDTSLRGDQIIEECQPDLTSGDSVHYYNLWRTTSCHEFDKTKMLLNCILK